MKIAHIFILTIILLLTSCEKQIRNDKLEEKEIELKEYSEPEAEDISEEAEEIPSIETVLDLETLFPDKYAVMKKDANLDIDNANEQFIVLTDSSNLVTFVVADFNKITREYFPAWQVDLPILYNSDFTMSEQDVLGIKQNMELVISGSTQKSSNALFVFKKTAPPKGLHIYYKNIFRYDDEGSATLVVKNRDLSYIEKTQDYGKAYDILVEKTNMVNENTISIIAENWVWDRRRNRFFKESSSTTQQKVNVKEKLRAVFQSNKKDFIKYISGEWYRDGKILIIDYKTETVTLKYEDGVETYDIFRSWKNYQRITFNLRNVEVSTIPLRLNIALNSTDTFTIANKTPTIWDGEYIRLNNELKEDLVSKTNTDIKEEPQFTGVFKNVFYSLNFSYPEYKKTNLVDNSIEEGIFSILKLSNGEQILQLKTKSQVRSEYSVVNYSLNYTEQNLESQVIRTINIHEGVLTTHGIELRPDTEVLKFEQTEVLNNE